MKNKNLGKKVRFVPEYLHLSEKFCTFAVAKVLRHTKQLTIMLQTQAYSQVLNMACMLSLAEQKRLINDVQTFISHIPINDESLQPYTWEELRARIRESEEQIARGEVYSEEESDKMFDEFITNELGIAI